MHLNLSLLEYLLQRSITSWFCLRVNIILSTWSSTFCGFPWSLCVQLFCKYLRPRADRNLRIRSLFFFFDLIAFIQEHFYYFILWFLFLYVLFPGWLCTCVPLSRVSNIVISSCAFSFDVTSSVTSNHLLSFPLVLCFSRGLHFSSRHWLFFGLVARII